MKSTFYVMSKFASDKDFRRVYRANLDACI